jgi:tetratricopeptide (TPR) repeat protein
MPARSHTRPRALSRCLALILLLPGVGVGCLQVPDNLDDPDAAPSAPSTVQELLDRHIAATGGAELLRPLTQRTVEARVIFRAQEGCKEGDEDCVWEETSGQFVLFSTADGRMYRRMVVGDNVLERGFDGETGWQMQAQPQVLVIEDPAAFAVLREDALLHWYFDVQLRDELALELLPSRKQEGGLELDGIVWFAGSATLPQAEKWFDRATGLLHEEIERDGETGDTVRRVYEDYREVDGVKVPWLIKQITEVEGYADHVVELVIQVVHHRPVREEMFAVPELGPTEPEPDQLLTLLEQAKTDAEKPGADLLAHVTHARLAYAAIHFDEAKAAAKRALALDKDEIEAIYILGRIALLEGDIREAEKLVRSAISKGLREDEAARQLAWIHIRRGEWAKAAKELEQAGSPELAERYAAFSGKPLDAKMGGDGCKTELTFEEIGGAIVVTVDADGTPLKLLLDTGASDLLLSDTRARSLVIGTDAEAPLVGGGPPLKQGQLDSLGIGDLTVANVPVTMIPDNQMGQVVAIEGIDGVLGIRAFAGRQLTVERSTKTMWVVEPGKRCAKQLDSHRSGISVPFWVHETHYIYLVGLLNGAEGLYLLNTGMRGADLTANGGAYAHAGVGAPPLLGGAPSLAPIESFALGEHQLKNLGAAWGFMEQNATTDGFRLDGMLGLGSLGGGTWTLDFEQQRMYLNPASDAPAKAPAKTKAPAGDEVPRGSPGGVIGDPIGRETGQETGRVTKSTPTGR